MTEYELDALEAAGLDNKVKAIDVNEFTAKLERALPGFKVEVEAYRDSESFKDIIRGMITLPMYFSFFIPQDDKRTNVLTDYEVSAVAKKAKSYYQLSTVENL